MVESERERGHHTEYRYSCSLESQALILATAHSQPSAPASSTSSEVDCIIFCPTGGVPEWGPCWSPFESSVPFPGDPAMPYFLTLVSGFPHCSPHSPSSVPPSRCAVPSLKTPLDKHNRYPGETRPKFPQAPKEKGDYIKNTFNHSRSVWLKEGKQKPWFMRQSPDPARMIQAGRGSAIYTDWKTRLPQREKDGIWSLLSERLSIWRFKTHQSCQAALTSLSGQGH